jgi:hypothetical protein
MLYPIDLIGGKGGTRTLDPGIMRWPGAFLARLPMLAAA